METMGLMSDKDYIQTSALAELCGITCQEEGWDWWKDPTGKSIEFIASGIKNAEAMIFKHWWVVWKRGGWEP
jgi:hypothetical protein